jgi:ATP-dependent DNA helicase RecG
MREKLTSLLQAVAEHGGTELELKYNEFFTATFRSRAQVTGQVTGQGGTRQSHGQSRGQSHRRRKSFFCPKKFQRSPQKFLLTDKWDTMSRLEGSHE